jgi:hypothetical protein
MRAPADEPVRLADLLAGPASVIAGGFVPSDITVSRAGRGDGDSGLDGDLVGVGDWRDLKARGECSSCNSGWTSQIEQSMSDIMPKLIRGEQTEVTPRDQRALPAWSILTILLLQRYRV